MGLLSALFGIGLPKDEELIEAINNGAFLVDVRTKDECRGSMVKGAINIPLDRIEKNLNKFKNKKTVIVFCESGSRSGVAKSVLKRNGIENVLNGGSCYRMEELV